MASVQTSPTCGFALREQRPVARSLTGLPAAEFSLSIAASPALRFFVFDDPSLAV